MSNELHAQMLSPICHSGYNPDIHLGYSSRIRHRCDHSSEEAIRQRRSHSHHQPNRLNRCNSPHQSNLERTHDNYFHAILLYINHSCHLSTCPGTEVLLPSSSTGSGLQVVCMVLLSGSESSIVLTFVPQPLLHLCT